MTPAFPLAAVLTVLLLMPAPGFGRDDPQTAHSGFHKGERTERFLERCEADGLTPEECRARLAERKEQFKERVLERCEAKGLSREECEARMTDHRERMERLRAECQERGLTPEECQARFKEEYQARIKLKCEEAGLTPEECREKFAKHRKHRHEDGGRHKPDSEGRE